MSEARDGATRAPSERRHRQRALVIVAVVVGVMFAALDQLIVITAMPRVVADLGGLADFAWVFTGYTLVSTVSLPVWGKLSDIYGRRRLWLAGLALFMTGSAIAGASQEMVQLIVSRGVQGLGAGALMALGPALIGDLFPPSERAKWQGALAAMFGLVVIAGPTIGGWITDTISWRWVFYVNLPFGGLAVVAAWFGLPGIRRGARPSIDVAGALTITAAAVPLLLAFSWAGVRYPWLSAPIVGLLVGAAAMLGLLVLLERRASDPMINLGFLTNRIYVVAISTTFLVSAGLIGTVLYIPLFAQAVIGTSATNSGAVLVPMMLAFVVSAIVSGQLMSRTGRYKLLILVLFAIGITGAVLLARMDASTTEFETARNMVIMGLGIGGLMSVLIVVAQNAFPDRNLGEVTAGSRFFRSIGSTIGAGLMGSLLSVWFAANMQERLPERVRDALGPERLAAVSNPEALFAPDAIASLQASVATLGAEGEAVGDVLLETLRMSLADALIGLFVVTAILMGVGFLIATRLPEIPLRKTRDADVPAGEAGAPAAEARSTSEVG